jgi:hypothetical protein
MFRLDTRSTEAEWLGVDPNDHRPHGAAALGSVVDILTTNAPDAGNAHSPNLGSDPAIDQAPNAGSDARQMRRSVRLDCAKWTGVLRRCYASRTGTYAPRRTSDLRVLGAVS